jgi:hypothetical protein
VREKTRWKLGRTSHWRDVRRDAAFQVDFGKLEGGSIDKREHFNRIWTVKNGRSYLSSKSVSPPNRAPRKRPSGRSASLICTSTPVTV